MLSHTDAAVPYGAGLLACGLNTDIGHGNRALRAPHKNRSALMPLRRADFLARGTVPSRDSLMRLEPRVFRFRSL